MRFHDLERLEHYFSLVYGLSHGKPTTRDSPGPRRVLNNAPRRLDMSD